MDVILPNNNIEAEHTAALLSRTNKKSFVMSKDTDIFMYGANSIHISYKTFEYYLIKDIRTYLDLSYDQFVKLCMALGNDYCPKVKGVGPKTVVDKIKTNKIKFNKRQLEAYNYVINTKLDYVLIKGIFNKKIIIDLLQKLKYKSDNYLYKYMANYSD